MDKIIIHGGRRLEGTVRISGSKNAALPILFSALLTDGVSTFSNVPSLRDIDSTLLLLSRLGARVDTGGGSVRFDAGGLSCHEAPYDLVRKMRASVLVLGSLVARLKRARVSLPGRCAIGARPINLHLKGLAAAEFGIAEALRNLPASWLRDLHLHLHLGHAMELVLWGDMRVSSQRAYEMGFYNKVVPADKLMEEAMSWAERMVNLAPRAVWNFKEIIKRGAYMEPKLGRAFGQALEQNLKGMEDTQEGAAALREKRKPVFKNQ